MALSASKSQAAATPQITAETITSGGRQRTYRLFVPATIAKDKSAPLILLLHPSGGDGLFLVQRWQTLAAREGIILVGPEAINSARWSAPIDGPDFLHDVVEAVRAKQPVNPRRIYLFGYSAGSGFAINMSLIQSEYFAATAVFASVSYKEQYVAAAVRKIPFFCTVGIDDSVFPVADARAARDGLKAHGFPVEWKELTNIGHDYNSRAAAINQAAWEFFKQHELTEESRYTDYQFRR